MTCRLDHEHRHGATNQCYNHGGCRCESCRVAHNYRCRKYQQAARRLKKSGVHPDPLVDARPIRTHVAGLQKAGMTIRQIAAAVGVSVGTLTHIVNSDQPRTHRSRVEAILSVKPTEEDALDENVVDGLGTRRRIQALVAQGWSMNKIAAASDVSTFSIHRQARVEKVRLRTKEAVERVFVKLWDKEPPLATGRDRVAYRQSLERAEREGWVGPLAWDDIDNDRKPKGVVKRRIAG